MPFTKQSTDFLFENTVRDSKEWFREHKAEYQKYVIVPFAEFIEAMRPVMADIDSRIECDPRRISRLYRDARYARGGSIFRDHIWCSFMPERGRYECPPGFYFEFSPNGFGYGFGYYQTPPDTLAEIRRMIIDRDPLAVAAVDSIEDQKIFELYGDPYKRDRYPEQEEKYKAWLNRRCAGVSSDSTDMELFTSERLAEKVGEDYRKLAPLCHFLLEAEERVLREKYRQ